MNKKKTAAAVVAGAMTVTALTVANVSEPAPGPEPAGNGIVEEYTRAGDGTFAGSMTALEKAVKGLVDKSDERGMTLPQSPGINDVTTGMDGMAPTKGTTRTVQVASNGAVAKGDYLKVCEEFTPLTDRQVTFAYGAYGGVKIVALASNGKDGINCECRLAQMAAVLYTQNGSTYLRMMRFEPDGSVLTGNRVTIASGVELERADMAMDHTYGDCIIAYNKDGDGWISYVEVTDRTLCKAALSWSDRWRQGGDPQNICMAYDNFTDIACVCSTVLPEGVTDEAQRYAVLDEMGVSTAGALVDDTPCALTSEAFPCLYGIDYSTAPTAGGWDVSYAAGWYYDMMARKEADGSWETLTDEDVAGFILLISYPKAEGNGRGLIVVDHNGNADCIVRNYIDTTAPGYSSGSTVAIDMAATNSDMGYVAMTDVVHSLHLGADNYLCIETYGIQKAGSKPVCYMRSKPEEVYKSSLDNISYAQLTRACAIGYTVDGALYAQIMEVQRAGEVFGPAVKVADVKGYAGIVPVSTDMAACIYVDSGGIGRIVPIQATRVVTKESDRFAPWAVGTALNGGEAGTTIRADLNYWPDEQW